MFIDTSVIVAILSNEPDATAFANKIEVAECCTSALVILEAAMRLSTKLQIDPVEVEQRIQALLIEAGITLAPMDARTANLAEKARRLWQRPGPSRPAQSG